MINGINLINSINTGKLDLILTKPLPSLFFLSFRRISLYKTTRDGIPPLILIALLINWNNITTTSDQLFSGFIILICGLIITNVMVFLSCLPAFWLGESSSLMQLVVDTQANAGQKFPFEGYSKPFRIFFLFIIPVAFSSGISTAVILGKLQIFPFLPIAIFMAIFYMFLHKLFWNLAIRNYTSASS